MSRQSLAEHAQIKKTFIFSQIFETQEDAVKNPFEFKTDGLLERSPADIGDPLISGYLLRRQGSAGENEDQAAGEGAAENNAETVFEKDFYVLEDDKLIRFASEDATVETGVLNIKNCRIKKHYFKDDTQQYMYGFVMMAKGKTIDLYLESLQEREEWIQAFKRHVIFLDLKDEFSVGKLLGRGNFAKVHLCMRRNDLSVKFALKTMQKSALQRSKRNITSVLTEIDVLRSLTHENVIQLHETYETSKYIHLVLPYLDGGELFERIKQKGLYRESDARPVMRNFILALEYLHEKNIVHRDLKPENLLLASKENCWDLKIADFGLACVIGDEKLYLRCGSPGYVAPELLQEKGYDCQADMFSVGVIFYIILTGRPLFKGNTPDEILEKNMNCDYTLNDRQWESISESAKDLCLKLLKEDPAVRFTARQALQHPWFGSDQEGEGGGFAGANLSEFNQQRKKMIFAKNPLVTCTPVMAGVKRQELPPETPFMQSDGQQLINRTPILRRFQVNSGGAAKDPPRQMQVMGMTFNRPNFSGAAANQTQQNNMLKQINEIKKMSRPNTIQGNDPPAGKLGMGLAQIPAFKGKDDLKNTLPSSKLQLVQQSSDASLVGINSVASELKKHSSQFQDAPAAAAAPAAPAAPSRGSAASIQQETPENMIAEVDEASEMDHSSGRVSGPVQIVSGQIKQSQLGAIQSNGSSGAQNLPSQLIFVSQKQQNHNHDSNPEICPTEKRLSQNEAPLAISNIAKISGQSLPKQPANRQNSQGVINSKNALMENSSPQPSANGSLSNDPNQPVQRRSSQSKSFQGYRLPYIKPQIVMLSHEKQDEIIRSHNDSKEVDQDDNRSMPAEPSNADSVQQIASQMASNQDQSASPELHLQNNSAKKQIKNDQDNNRVQSIIVIHQQNMIVSDNAASQAVQVQQNQQQIVVQPKMAPIQIIGNQNNNQPQPQQQQQPQQPQPQPEARSPKNGNNVAEGAAMQIEEEKNPVPKLIMKQEDLDRAKLQNEEEAQLLRSARYENFDERMVNEYVSSDEDNNAIIEEGKSENDSELGNLAADDNVPRKKKAGSMIFPPFKPGRVHQGLRQFPLSALDIKNCQPLFQRNIRKLPYNLAQIQQKREVEMMDAMKQSNIVSSQEAKARNEKVRAMLDNIPYVSKDQLEQNRQKIAAQNAANKVEKKISSEIAQQHLQQKSLLEELKREIESNAAKAFAKGNLSPSKSKRFSSRRNQDESEQPANQSAQEPKLLQAYPAD